MRTTYNGFEIAERDLMNRGPGDFFAALSGGEAMRQSGGLKFKLASLCNDPEMLERAFSAGKAIIAQDPELVQPENALLRALIADYSQINTSTLS